MSGAEQNQHMKRSLLLVLAVLTSSCGSPPLENRLITKHSVILFGEDLTIGMPPVSVPLLMLDLETVEGHSSSNTHADIEILKLNN